MKRVGRAVRRFRDNPTSLRHATTAIISVTVIVVVLGSLVVWVFDRSEFPTFGSAMWFTLQTVTTVGYGDSTPAEPVGQVVASVVMLAAIGLITVVTAAITSRFISAARAELERNDENSDADALARIEAMLATINERLDRIEADDDPDPPD